MSLSRRHHGASVAPFEVQDPRAEDGQDLRAKSRSKSSVTRDQARRWRNDTDLILTVGFSTRCTNV
ncbi:hypothetical protein B0T18DRAFT_38845 [Schizothecium vesticola]|uniref:Uncharacterized protein n=1 Tax=Schizothecium vesticola TaxID=314040 RepID=A0AA40KD64_9PEZI|nr:hypothetical protein B0T18DRAFT_38845 [Schizothecium vesticola]